MGLGNIRHGSSCRWGANTIHHSTEEADMLLDDTVRLAERVLKVEHELRPKTALLVQDKLGYWVKK